MLGGAVRQAVIDANVETGNSWNMSRHNLLQCCGPRWRRKSMDLLWLDGYALCSATEQVLATADPALQVK